MSSNSIPLGCPDSTLSRDDLLRALFCAEAVYKDVAGTEVLLRETQRGNPSVKFQKIHMSVDLFSDGQKFLAAYAEDAIFIAFRGTTTHKDMASDLRTDYHHKFGGSFHAGFLNAQMISCMFMMKPWQAILFGSSFMRLKNASSSAGIVWAGPWRTWCCYSYCLKETGYTTSW